MKKVLFIFLCAFLSFICAITLLVYPKVKKDDAKTVDSIEIWHIDGFEGGIGSRYSCLVGVAKDFMLKNDTVIRVINHTEYSAEGNFNKGIFPDIISYSNGIDLPYERVIKFKAQNNDVYAFPWCMGAYVCITRKGVDAEKLIISQQKNTIPLLAVRLSGIKGEIKCIVSSSEAINEFYLNKDCALIGTQRDLFRLENKGLELDVRYLSGYNDLFQYLSVFKNDKNIEKVNNFINFLIEKTVYSNVLKKIGMLSYLGYLEKNCAEQLNCFKGYCYEYATQPLINPFQLKKLQEQVLNFDKEKESIKSALKRLK